MGRPLFQLEDDFIDSMCFGFSDADTSALFADALDDGRLALQDSVRQRMKAAPHLAEYADDTTVALFGGDFVVMVPEVVEDEVLGFEYGDSENRPMPVLRQGVQEGRWAAETAITRGLDLP